MSQAARQYLQEFADSMRSVGYNVRLSLKRGEVSWPGSTLVVRDVDDGIVAETRTVQKVKLN